jgi:hypothetical protein
MVRVVTRLIPGTLFALFSVIVAPVMSKARASSVTLAAAPLSTATRFSVVLHVIVTLVPSAMV